ncbi:MAG: XDD3 family exosortase-dependent surface protein [Cyanobacteria bacterium P01_H01_bin.58]
MSCRHIREIFQTTYQVAKESIEPKVGVSNLKLATRIAIASIGIAAATGSSAQAASFSNGTFSLWLECNNDGIAHVLGGSPSVNGWQYTSDARNDNTDGYFYDIAGIAVKTIGDEVVVAVNGNTPLTGTGFDRNANQVVWGDLFFTSGEQTFTDAMNSGNLFGIHFADSNESGVSEVGVYHTVTGRGVGVNNFGHRTYGNYMNLVESETDAANFLGSFSGSDLQGQDAYVDVNGAGYNVIGQGTRSRNDGFAMLQLGDALLADLDLTQFQAAGDETIAFKFNQSALEYQPTLEEQAAEYGVEWIWDEQGIEPGTAGFTELDTEITAAQTESSRLQKEEIKPLNKAIEALRQQVDGYAEVKAARDAVNSRKNLQKSVDTAQSVIDVLSPKKATWDAMTPEEQANAAPEAVWTRKDQEDWEFQNDIVNEKSAKIAAIDAEYTTEQLESAKKDYNTFIKNVVRKNPTVSQEHNALEAERKVVVNAKKAQDAKAKTLKAERQALEDHILAKVTTLRQEQLDQRLAEAASAAAAEEALETETGGPRQSKDGGIPTTEAEFLKIQGTETESVPEPSTALGALILATCGAFMKKRRQG